MAEISMDPSQALKLRQMTSRICQSLSRSWHEERLKVARAVQGHSDIGRHVAKILRFAVAL